MPVVKLAATKNGRRLANYLQRDDQGNDRAVFVSESNNEQTERVNSAQHAERDFQSVRENYGKTDGVQAHMAYISFKKDDLGDLAKPDGKPDWEKIEAFTHEHARRAGIAENHQYYIVAHKDKANPHVHLVWNAVSEEGGKYQQGNDVARQREIANVLAEEHGIKYRFEQEKNPEKVPDAVIRGVQNGAPAYSWKRDLQYRVRDAATRATSWGDFKKRLEKQGVETRERGKGVSYSFKDDRKRTHIARGSRLGEAYTRDDIERRFPTNASRQQVAKTWEDRERNGQALTYDKEHFRSWQQELRAAFHEAEKRAHSPEEFHKLAQERGLTVGKNTEGQYELRYHDRYGTEHAAAANVLRKGTTDQALDARIERTSDNPVHRTESAAPAPAHGAAPRRVESLTQPLTTDIERNSTPQGGTPECGFDRTRDRERERTRTGNEDGMRSHEGLGHEGW